MNTTVKNLFTTFCKVYNLKTTAKHRDDVPGQTTFYSNDFVTLDYAPHYGGYRIDIIETGTGQRDFYTNGRMTAKEMISFLKGLIAAKNAYLFEGIVNDELTTA